jgi:hypothetical protein
LYVGSLGLCLIKVSTILIEREREREREREVVICRVYYLTSIRMDQNDEKDFFFFFFNFGSKNHARATWPTRASIGEIRARDI